MKISYEPTQELLLKALITEGESGLNYALDWLDNIDLDEIDGGSHRLLPMFYKKFSLYEPALIQKEYFERLQGIYKYYLYKNNMIIHNATKIFQALDQAGIHFMLLKGAGFIIGGYYQDYAIRPMSDIDMLVGKSDLEETLAILYSFNWQKLNVTDHALSLRSKANCTIDLHWYSLKQCCCDHIDQDLWKYAEVMNFNGTNIYLPSPTDQIWHNCAHGIKNNTLAPIRWVVDVVTVLKERHDCIDWQRFLYESKKRNISLTALQALLYIDKLASHLVPGWVVQELSKIPVSRIENMYLIALTGDYGKLVKLWGMHNIKNYDKSIAYNLVAFPYFVSQRVIRKIIRIVHPSTLFTTQRQHMDRYMK